MVLAQLCGFVFVLSVAIVWNFGFKWKMDGSVVIVLSSSKLLVFLGESYLSPLRFGWSVFFKSWLNGCIHDSRV